MPGRRILACGVATTLLLVGCGGDDDGGPTTTRPVSASVITPLTVEVIEPGAAPRAVLRHELEAGQTWQGELSFDVEAGPTVLAVEGDSLIDVVAVEADGTATADYRLADLDLAVAGAAPTVDALDISGDLVVEADRTVTSATIRAEGEAVANEVIEAALDPRLPSLLLPQPDEPVGVGARWRVRGPISLLGTIVDLDAVVRLTRREGSRFDLAVTFELRQSDRAGLVLDGLGQIGGDTTQLGPVSGSLAVAGTLFLPGGDRPQPASFELTITEQ